MNNHDSRSLKMASSQNSIIDEWFNIYIQNPTNMSYTFHFNDSHIFNLTAINAQHKVVWHYPDEKTTFKKTPVDITVDPVNVSKYYGRNVDILKIGEPVYWDNIPDGGMLYIWATLVGYNTTRGINYLDVQKTHCEFYYGCTKGFDGGGPIDNIPPPVPPSNAADHTNDAIVMGAGLGGAVASFGAIGAVMMTETGKYAAFGIIAPLYTRLRKGMVLDHFPRGQIHGYILANPGTHMNAIRDKFNLNNGVVAYHLKVLEREGYIISKVDGLKRRFYPSDWSEHEFKDEKMTLTVAQSLLVSHILRSQGITQTELARLANTSTQVVNYHIKKLDRMNLVDIVQDGRTTKCFARKNELEKYRLNMTKDENEKTEDKSNPETT